MTTTEKMTHGQVLLTLVMAGLWLVSNGYIGIGHDARLYTGEALQVLHPEVFQRDIFFMFGSQGDFSLFPHVYAWMISLLGIKVAAFWLTLAGKLLWFYALLRLIRIALPAKTWMLALAAVVIHSPYYDSFRIFSYGESFASPRLFAEALTMLALAACMEGRLLWGICLSLSGMLLHPLMVLVFLPVLYGYAYGACRRFRFYLILGGCLGVLTVIVLALAEIRPFGDLLRQMDNTWWTVIERRCNYIPLGFVDGDFLGRVAYLMTVAGLAIRYLRDGVGRPMVGIAVSSMCCLLLWAGGTWIVHDALVAQLQLWRSLWLLQLFVCIALGGLVCHFWKGSSLERILVPSVLAGFLDERWTAFLFPLCGMMLVWWLGRQPEHIQRRMLWRGVAWVAVIPSVMFYLLSRGNDIALQSSLETSGWNWWLFGYSVLAILAIALLWAVRGKRAQAFMCSFRASLAVLAVAFSGLAWSSVYLQNIHEEADQPGIADLRVRIPAGSLIVSDLQMRWVWTVLERGNYGGFLPMTESVFSRPMAVEGWRRLLRMHEVHIADSQLDWADREEPESRKLTLENIHYLCRDPVLDFVVLKGRYAEGEVFPLASGLVSVFECARLEG